jgi:hypothetical protein
LSPRGRSSRLHGNDVTASEKVLASLRISSPRNIPDRNPVALLPLASYGTQGEASTVGMKEFVHRNDVTLTEIRSVLTFELEQIV